MVHIGVIGDYDPTKETHLATDLAIGHAAASLGVVVDARWIPTQAVEANRDEALDDVDGYIIAPGSPYRSLAGALIAIEAARIHDVPLLGTCGGFQHVVLEFARNVAGFRDAQHAEYDPYASDLFITPLSCSLFGQSMMVHLVEGTHAADAYGCPTTSERYYCNFGLNPARVDTIVDAGLVVSGTDQDGEQRILELPGHPFFVATLFVPQTSSTPRSPHPLVAALVAAAGTAVTSGGSSAQHEPS